MIWHDSSRPDEPTVHSLLTGKAAHSGQMCNRFMMLVARSWTACAAGVTAIRRQAGLLEQVRRHSRLLILPWAVRRRTYAPRSTIRRGSVAASVRRSHATEIRTATAVTRARNGPASGDLAST